MIFFKCVQKSKFLLSKDNWIFLVVGKYQSRAPATRVSKSHGLTVMRQCQKILTLRKIFGFSCAN